MEDLIETLAAVMYQARPGNGKWKEVAADHDQGLAISYRTVTHELVSELLVTPKDAQLALAPKFGLLLHTHMSSILNDQELRTRQIQATIKRFRELQDETIA